MPKPSVALICAMTQERVIGKDNALPWKISEDLQRFKALTVGKPVIMGRKTYESLGKALPLRTNLVMTRQEDFKPSDSIVVSTLGEALQVANTICRHSKAEEIMVIGGGEIYRQALPVADTVYATIIDDHCIKGDTFFPELGEDWYMTSGDFHNGSPSYTFVTLKKDKGGS